MKWKYRRKWTVGEIAKYRTYAIETARSFVDAKTKLTCEDLPLRVLIEYARARGLPILIQNGVFPRGANPRLWEHDLSFMNSVLRTTGASDLLRTANVEYVGSSKRGQLANLRLAEPGDMIILGTSHTQLIIGKTKAESGKLGYKVEIAQGNVPAPDREFEWSDLWDNPNDPSSEKYFGSPVKTFFYKTDGHYKGATSAGDVFRNGVVVRWKFKSWNSEADKRGSVSWNDLGR